MKKFCLALFALFFISSCSLKTVPLKGAYMKPPYQITVDKPFAKVWDSIIDMFAQKGLSIKLIDRSSGLIVSERSALTWSYEDKNGRLQNPGAWVALPRMWSPGQNRYIDDYTIVTGDWNIRIKEVDGGMTAINVNLVNIVGVGTFAAYAQGTNSTINEAKSTGVFEELIALTVKN